MNLTIVGDHPTALCTAKILAEQGHDVLYVGEPILDIESWYNIKKEKILGQITQTNSLKEGISWAERISIDVWDADYKDIVRQLSELDLTGKIFEIVLSNSNQIEEVEEIFADLVKNKGVKSFTTIL
jgi:hypothetical protein